MYLFGFCLFFCPPSANLHSNGSVGAVDTGRPHERTTVAVSDNMGGASSQSTGSAEEEERLEGPLEGRSSGPGTPAVPADVSELESHGEATSRHCSTVTLSTLDPPQFHHWTVSRESPRGTRNTPLASQTALCSWQRVSHVHHTPCFCLQLV